MCFRTWKPITWKYLQSGFVQLCIILEVSGGNELIAKIENDYFIQSSSLFDRSTGINIDSNEQN